jgi:hypothetical protein
MKKSLGIHFIKKVRELKFVKNNFISFHFRKREMKTDEIILHE